MPYLVSLWTVLDIIQEFDRKMRYQWWDIEDEIQILIADIENLPNFDE